MSACLVPAGPDLRTVDAQAACNPRADCAAEGAPDAACEAVGSEGAVVARCSLWWRNAPYFAGRRAGLIGHYCSAGTHAGERLIAHACAKLAARGCTVAVGPMDGSTWDAYRFVTQRGDAPRFFMEPDNDDDWPLQFRRCGFTAIAQYRSTLQADLAFEDPRIGRVGERLAAAGVAIRSIDTQRFAEELEKLHALALAGFRDRPLFTPIGAQAFARRYRGLRPFLHPEIVLIAEQRGAPVALFFAVPDLAQRQRGEQVDTAIVKTVVALPGRAVAGIAHVMAARAAAVAREAGYRRAIHALMHASAHSANWSARCGETMRRYTLFAKPLAG